MIQQYQASQKVSDSRCMTTLRRQTLLERLTFASCELLLYTSTSMIRVTWHMHQHQFRKWALHMQTKHSRGSCMLPWVPSSLTFQLPRWQAHGDSRPKLASSLERVMTESKLLPTTAPLRGSSVLNQTERCDKPVATGLTSTNQRLCKFELLLHIPDQRPAFHTSEGPQK